MTINNQIANIKNWALTQQDYSIDELLQLEEFEYQGASPEVIKTILDGIRFKDRVNAIKNWAKNHEKSIHELYAQEEYEYIHAPPKIIKTVIENIINPPCGQTQSSDWLYIAGATLGAIMLTTLAYYHRDQILSLARYATFQIGERNQEINRELGEQINQERENLRYSTPGEDYVEQPGARCVGQGISLEDTSGLY